MVQEIHQSAYVKAGVAIPENFVVTPGGFRHKSMIHHVEQGHAIKKAEGKLLKIDPSTSAVLGPPVETVATQAIPSLGSGWITYAEWSNATGRPISSFATTWVVPAAPSTQSGQTVFIFNSLEDSAQDDIIQPVLQWGISGAGGGDYWAIANWYVDSSGHAFYSSLVPVNVGDTLKGLITLTGRSGSAFNYQSEFQGIGGTTLPVLNISELSWATETLECYQISQCSDYPNCQMTPMTSIDLRVADGAAPVSWTITNQYVDCGQSTVIANASNPGGEVDIIY